MKVPINDILIPSLVDSFNHAQFNEMKITLCEN